MATIINNPGSGSNGENNGGGAGMIIGIIVAIVIVALFVIYGLPAMRGTSNDATPNSTEINVPDSVDVNVDDNTGN